jgi:hypothetical protein
MGAGQCDERNLAIVHKKLEAVVGVNDSALRARTVTDTHVRKRPANVERDDRVRSLVVSAYG